MDFCAVLDQALALLRQRGRVSYRTLQRQFDLDDASLADLKDALVFGEPCVVDEEGRGLVWTGAPPAVKPDTGQKAEAERQFHTVLLAIMALLEREKRVTYRTLHYVLGVDEACLHAVRDELCFRQLAHEVEQAYTQARVLCQQLGETPQLVPVLFGLWRYYLGRSQLHTARELGETLLRLAQQAHDPALAVVAHYTLGVAWWWLGALPAARQHLEEGIACYTPEQRRAPAFHMGQDPGVGCRANAARTLWLLGYPAQALVHVHEALAVAHELSHPYSLAFAWCVAAFVFQFCRDVPAVHQHAEAAVALSTAQGFPQWAAMGRSLRGWALAMQGQGEEGMAQVRQEISAYRATGTTLAVPYFYTLLAEVCDHLGHIEDGLQALAEVHTLVEQQEDRWCEAESARLRGVLLLRQPGTPQAEAETCFRQALDVSRRQEAKALELRAAMSLSRLWQQQGKRAEAYDLLTPIYGWFTEGFDTADLQEAKALLDELA